MFHVTHSDEFCHVWTTLDLMRYLLMVFKFHFIFYLIFIPSWEYLHIKIVCGAQCNVVAFVVECEEFLDAYLYDKRLC